MGFFDSLFGRRTKIIGGEIYAFENAFQSEQEALGWMTQIAASTGGKVKCIPSASNRNFEVWVSTGMPDPRTQGQAPPKPQQEQPPQQ